MYIVHSNSFKLLHILWKIGPNTLYRWAKFERNRSMGRLYFKIIFNYCVKKMKNIRQCLGTHISWTTGLNFSNLVCKVMYVYVEHKICTFGKNRPSSFEIWGAEVNKFMVPVNNTHVLCICLGRSFLAADTQPCVLIEIWGDWNQQLYGTSTLITHGCVTHFSCLVFLGHWHMTVCLDIIIWLPALTGFGPSCRSLMG